MSQETVWSVSERRHRANVTSADFRMAWVFATGWEKYSDQIGALVRENAPTTRAAYANRNSFVRNSLTISRSFAAFSNSNRLAASRISLSSFAM